MADGEAMTQWPMDDLAAVGMLKMDFLGLRALTIIDRTLHIIRAGGREAPSLHPGDLDLRDEQTYRLISQGLTQGIFQLGSGGMQRMLRRLQPRNLEDLIAAVALYRPGPLQSGMVDDFIDCRHGRREITFPHPAFEPILEPTYGVIVYQEQIMRICNRIAGMKLGDALTMIKAISKKSEEKVSRYHEDFVNGAVANGVDRETAEEVFGLIMHFAGYGFNKAHASAYAFLAFVTAFLKAHHTTEFMASSISCEMGTTDQVVALMEECAKLGIEVLPPDINESHEEFTRVSEGRLRFGLGAVKNVGSKAIECAVKAREKGGPFRSLFDFCERVDPHEVTKGAVEGLMKAGCFDSLPGHRGQQLAVLDNALKIGARARKNRMAGQKSLFGAVAEEDPEKRMVANLPDVPPLSQRELARQESEALGLYVRYDPLAESRARLARFSTATGDQLEELPDEHQVVMGGMIEDVRRRTTRSNDPMAVLKVLGVKSPFECVLFPRAYKEFKEIVEPGAVLFFAGTVSHRRDTSVQVEAVIPFDKAQARLAESMFVTVQADDAGGDFWGGLKAVLERHAGSVPVYVDIRAEGYRLRTRVANGTTVKATDALADELEELVGPGTVQFGISLASARPRDNGRGRRRRNGASGYANSRN
jgi:DNA polymerase-3 subunit alpha